MGRKPWITTLVLVGVLAALTVIVLLVQRLPAPSGEGASLTPAPLWTFSGSDVVGITVTVGLERAAAYGGAGDWRVLQPAEGEADEARLIRLSSDLASLQYTRVLADVDNLAEFGLQPPQAQATLVLSDGTTLDLFIGTTNPGGASRYVQKAGDPKVYLVSAYMLQNLLDLTTSPPYAPTPIPTSGPVETPTAEPTLPPTATPTRTPRPTPSPSPTPSS